MNKLKVEDIAARIKANDFLKKEQEEKKFPKEELEESSPGELEISK